MKRGCHSAAPNTILKGVCSVQSVFCGNIKAGRGVGSAHLHYRLDWRQQMINISPIVYVYLVACGRVVT
jgi:hypothetical protein